MFVIYKWPRGLTQEKELFLNHNITLVQGTLAATKPSQKIKRYSRGREWLFSLHSYYKNALNFHIKFLSKIQKLNFNHNRLNVSEVQ